MFELDQDQREQYDTWRKDHNCKINPDKVGAIGGRFAFTFIPTGLGTIVKVKCACGAELDVTDYEHW